MQYEPGVLVITLCTNSTFFKEEVNWVALFYQLWYFALWIITACPSIRFALIVKSVKNTINKFWNLYQLQKALFFLIQMEWDHIFSSDTNLKSNRRKSSTDSWKKRQSFFCIIYFVQHLQQPVKFDILGLMSFVKKLTKRFIFYKWPEGIENTLRRSQGKVRFFSFW